MLRLQELGIAVVSDTTVHHEHCLRVAINNHRTKREDLQLLFRGNDPHRAADRQRGYVRGLRVFMFVRCGRDGARRPTSDALITDRWNFAAPYGTTRKSVELECGAAAVGRAYRFAAPFVWRCLRGSTMAPFPHPSHRTGHADFPHPALGQDLTPSSTARHAQAGSDARARSARRGARVDSFRLFVA